LWGLLAPWWGPLATCVFTAQGGGKYVPTSTEGMMSPTGGRKAWLPKPEVFLHPKKRIGEGKVTFRGVGGVV